MVGARRLIIAAGFPASLHSVTLAVRVTACPCPTSSSQSTAGSIIHAPVPEPAMFPIFMSVVFAQSDLGCRENMRI